MGFSISGGMRAWKFADLDPKIIATQMGWKAAQAKAELAVLRRQHADAAWIDAALAELSVPSLAILAALVDAGGHGPDREVLADAAQTHKISTSSLAMAVGPLLRKLLVVTTTTGRDTHFNLVEPSAALIAARLENADIPPLPAGVPFVAAEGLDEGRALLAVCAALDHVELKLTQAGSPHRGGIKRIAKAIGLEDEMLDRLVILGLDLKILAQTDEDVVRPVASRLRELARGRVYPRLRILSAFVERLRTAGGPVPSDLVERWARAAWRTAIGAAPSADLLGLVPGIRRGKVGEIDVLAAVALEGTASASITPSFEVFVPPESRAEHLVAILSCAELVRIDRVIVARITKTSVQRAVAVGSTAASIITILREASRTPLPQNIEAAIVDWAGGPVALTTVGRVVIVPVADEARVVAQLEPYAARVIAPGVLVVRSATPARALAGALARIGIPIRVFEEPQVDDDVDVDDDDDDGDGDRGERSPSIARLLPLAAGDPAIQRRFAAYQAGDADEIAKAPSGFSGAGRASHAGAGGSPSGADDLDDGNEDQFVSDRAIALIETWEDSRGCRLDDDVAMTAAALLDAISSVDQSYLLGAKSPAQLRDRLKQVAIHRGGFEALFAKNREFIEASLGSGGVAELADLVRATRPELGNGRSQVQPAAISSRAGADSNREWYTRDLHARLLAAARTQSRYTLDLGGGRTHTVRIRKVIQRGSATMVLGEDVDDDSAMALPLGAILRIAEPMPESPGAARPEGTLNTSSPSMPWRPIEGQSPPAGHVPCPCGSGVRYRSCCRPKN